MAPGAFAALLDTGSVLCWGHRDLGGVCPALEGGTQLVATNGAFAAVLAEGVVTWGSVFAGDGDGSWGDGLYWLYIYNYVSILALMQCLAPVAWKDKRKSTRGSTTMKDFFSAIPHVW